MNKKTVLLAAALTGVLSWNASGQGQAQPAPPSPLEQRIKEIKNPTPWLTWGGDFRARNEYLDTTLVLDENNILSEQDYFRFRARLYTTIRPVEDVSVNARLATEPRVWMRRAGYSPVRGHTGLDWTEGVIDNLNLQWKNILGQPLSMIVGRQDLFLGEGWLTGDGTPYDGSWTYYLDAARLTYELKDQKTVIEAIGILQTAEDDAWLPTINNQNRYLAEQHEKGAILNIINTSLPAANLNPYFIYKHDDKINEPGAPAGGDNADIYTAGARISGLVKDHWKYSVEGAYQFGEKQDTFVRYPEVSDEFRDINAFGLNAKLFFLFKDKINNQLGFSYEYLSGDDPNTAEDEMFDVLWGRYPRWSEIGLYSFARETRIGQQANYHRFGPSWTCNPMKGMEFSVNYYALFADQEIPTRENSSALFTHNDSFRGHFVAAMLKHKFTSRLTGHLWGELQFPGDYYVNDHVMSFLRAELMFSF